MSATEIVFTLEAKGGQLPLTLKLRQAVIAGWTGRDPRCHRH
jgi:hypothetical protein